MELQPGATECSKWIDMDYNKTIITVVETEWSGCY